LQPFLIGTAAITDKHKGFAPIGMMEQWNCGMMGFKKTEFKAANFAFVLNQYSSIPIFHYFLWLTKAYSHEKYYNSKKLNKFRDV